jgi:hypothetical protein
VGPTIRQHSSRPQHRKGLVSKATSSRRRLLIEQPAIAVALDHVGLGHDGFALDQLAREGRRLSAERLDRRPVLAASLGVSLELRAAVRLRRVDPNEPRPLLVAGGEAKPDGVAVGDPGDGCGRKTGGLAGETQEAEAGATQRAASYFPVQE